MMKAAVFSKYGGPEVIRIEEQKIPEPNDNEILIRVAASSLNSGDWRLRSLDVPRGFGLMVRLYFGFLRPRQPVLGSELSGVIVAKGKQCKKFNVGDEIIAMTGIRLGAHSEYISLPGEALIVPKPQTLNWHTAAALCFGGTTAVDFLMNKGGLTAGDHVLINGASGTVGTAAIQIAKHAGAKVTAVCSYRATRLVKSLGADHVINYETEDFRDYRKRWDVILDTVGNARWKESRQTMKANGRLLRVVADMKDTLLSFTHKDSSGRKEITGTAREHIDDLNYLTALAADGAFRPVIHKVLPFSEVRAAHQAIERPGKHGSIVLAMT